MTFSNQWKSEYASSVEPDVKDKRPLGRSSPLYNPGLYHEDFKGKLQVELQLKYWKPL